MPRMTTEATEDPPLTTHDRSLRSEEKRRLVLLGLPTFGLALSITVVSTYLPTVLQGFTTSTTTVGMLIGAEGLLALMVPIVVGTWSDRLRTRLGGRLPFIIAGVPVAAAGLVAMAVARALPAAAV